jgi:hypothetical protein
MFFVRRIGYDMFNMLWKLQLLKLKKKCFIGSVKFVYFVAIVNNLCVMPIQSKMEFVIAAKVF